MQVHKVEPKEMTPNLYGRESMTANKPVVKVDIPDIVSVSACADLTLPPGAGLCIDTNHGPVFLVSILFPLLNLVCLASAKIVLVVHFLKGRVGFCSFEFYSKEPDVQKNVLVSSEVEPKNLQVDPYISRLHHNVLLAFLINIHIKRSPNISLLREHGL